MSPCPECGAVDGCEHFGPASDSEEDSDDDGADHDAPSKNQAEQRPGIAKRQATDSSINEMSEEAVDRDNLRMVIVRNVE